MSTKAAESDGPRWQERSTKLIPHIVAPLSPNTPPFVLDPSLELSDDRFFHNVRNLDGVSRFQEAFAARTEEERRACQLEIDTHADVVKPGVLFSLLSSVTVCVVENVLWLLRSWNRKCVLQHDEEI